MKTEKLETKSLATILEGNANLTLNHHNRIVCSITGHEMPANVKAVIEYLASARLKKSLEWYSKDFSKYLPYIVEDKNNPKRLYCRLTKVFLSKIPSKVENHVNGKKFQRLKIEADKKSNNYRMMDETKKETPDFWMPEIENDEDSMKEDDDEDEDEDTTENVYAEAEKSSKSSKSKRKKSKDEADHYSDEDFIISKKNSKSPKIRKK